MTPQMLETLILRYYSVPMPHYVFGWQGGEPSLMGLDFYRQAVQWQKHYLPHGSTFSNGFQTNGTLLDENWADFFREHHFLIGLSMDGPCKLHDANRIDVFGHGTFHRVEQAIRLLQRSHVEFNAMVLVNRQNAGHAANIYDFLIRKKIFHHQYIECVEPDNPLSLTADLWGTFLCSLFDHWSHADTGRTSIRLFDSIAEKLAGRPGSCCCQKEDCRNDLVVESNGEVYPCDFHVLPEWQLGNIANDDLLSLWNSEKFKKFGQIKPQMTTKCIHCEFRFFCHGDCPKNRIESQGSALCNGWKTFYRHALPKFRKILEIKKSSPDRQPSTESALH